MCPCLAYVAMRSSNAWWQDLYLRPLPHQQGSLRPIFLESDVKILGLVIIVCFFLSYFTGNVAVMVTDVPSFVVASIFPLWASMTARAMERPMP